MPCPSCGLTHGLHALLEGHFADSVRLYPLTPITMVGLLAFATLLAAEAVSGRPLIPPRTIQVTAWIFILLVLTAWPLTLFDL